MIKIKKNLILLILIISIIITVVGNHLNNKRISVSKYDISISKLPKEFNNYKILQLSDLHSKEFKKDNQKLVDKINKINPNIIVMTGDMYDRSDENGNININLIKKLKYKYPIYYINGNHELDVIKKNDPWVKDYYTELKKLKIKLLKDECIKITKHNKFINLCGLEIPLENYLQKKKLKIPNHLKYMNENNINILLAHNPIYFDEYEKSGYDVIISGHIHGGGIRMPLIGGILSPDITFFPKYNSGLYKINKSKLIVSRGFGGLRVFNSPELVVITLKK